MVPGRRGTTSAATKDDFITHYNIVYILLYYFTTMAVLFYLSFFSRSAFACMLLYTRALCRRNRSGSRVYKFRFDDQRIYRQVFCILLLNNNDTFDSSPPPPRIDFKILVDHWSYVIQVRGESIGGLRHSKLIRI